MRWHSTQLTALHIVTCLRTEGLALPQLARAADRTVTADTSLRSGTSQSMTIRHRVYASLRVASYPTSCPPSSCAGRHTAGIASARTYA